MKAFLLCAVIALSLQISLFAAEPLRVGTNLWPGYEPIHLAKQLEYWDEGKEIRTIEYPSAGEVIRAFRNKALDVAGLTLDEVFLLRQAKFPVKVILVLDTSFGGDVIVANSKYPTIKQLKGKRIGVEAGALGAFVISRALQLHQMKLQDIQPVPMPVNVHERSFKRGTIDAVVTFEPVRTKLLDFGAVEVFTSREIPGEIVDVLVVHEDAIRGKEAQIKKLVSGWFKAVEYLDQQPQKASAIIAKRLKISSEDVLASYSGLTLGRKTENFRLLSGEKPQLEKTLLKLKLALVEHQLVPATIKVDQLLTDQFLIVR